MTSREFIDRIMELQAQHKAKGTVPRRSSGLRWGVVGKPDGQVAVMLADEEIVFPGTLEMMVWAEQAA